LTVCYRLPAVNGFGRKTACTVGAKIYGIKVVASYESLIKMKVMGKSSIHHFPNM
jgi:hypothetical protein